MVTGIRVYCYSNNCEVHPYGNWESLRVHRYGNWESLRVHHYGNWDSSPCTINPECKIISEGGRRRGGRTHIIVLVLEAMWRQSLAFGLERT